MRLFSFLCDRVQLRKVYLFILTAFGYQLATKAQIEGGPLVGVNRSVTAISADCARRSAAPGWMVGFFVRAGSRAFAEMAPQYITVSEMTAGADRLRPLQDGEEPYLKGRLSVRYLHFPVTAAFKVYQQEDLNVRIGMGGAFSWMTGLRNNPFDLHRQDFYTKDVAVLGKMGVDFNRFVVDLQYSYGMHSRLRNMEARMQVFSFTVGYKIWGQYVLKRSSFLFPG